MQSPYNMEHKPLWFKIKDVTKFKEIPKYSSKIITKTNNLFYRMNKLDASSKPYVQYNNNNNNQDSNLHLTDLYCSKPNTKENLKLELIKMLMPRGAELSRKELQLELNISPSHDATTCKNKTSLRKIRSFYPKLKSYHMSLKKNPYLTHLSKSNSMLTLPKYINLYNNTRNELLPISNVTISNKSLSNCSSISSPKHSTHCVKPFLRYTKHTEKIQLYRNKLTKIEEDIRRDINCSMSGLNWFNREYNKKIIAHNT